MSSNVSHDYRAFRGIWIPAEVWLSPDMTIQEKVMLVEINSLQHPERGCYKSNRALAEFFGLSASRVSEVISSLAAKGLVRVETIRNGRQVVERRIFMTTPFGIPKPPPSEKAANPFGKGGEPPSGNAEESNTSLRGSMRGPEEDIWHPQKYSTTRGTRLPADWTLPPEWRAWAKAEHPAINTDLEAAKFCDYWRAKSGPGATKLDWQATWRNWIRNARPNGALPNGRNTSSGGQVGYASEDVY